MKTKNVVIGVLAVIIVVLAVMLVFEKNTNAELTESWNSLISEHLSSVANYERELENCEREFNIMSEVYENKLNEMQLKYENELTNCEQELENTSEELRVSELKNQFKDAEVNFKENEVNELKSDDGNIIKNVKAKITSIFSK